MSSVYSIFTIRLRHERHVVHARQRARDIAALLGFEHQEQIRLATDRPGIMTRDLYHPVLDCFLRGLPHAFREVEASRGAVLVVEISGECGGQWFLERGTTGWALVPGSDGDFTARVTVPQDLAWRLFTKGIDRSSARAQLNMEGDRGLGEKILNLTAIVA